MINALYLGNFTQYKPISKVQTKQYTSLKPLERDTVSFTSKKILDLTSKEMSKKIMDSIKDENRMGLGSEGAVYRIKDTDFCVKIPKGSSMYGLDTWKTNINKQDKINHIVARSYNDATIMKVVEGKALRWVKPDEIYDLPKSSYKSFMKQLQTANDAGLNFDNAPANIIYNSKEKTFTLIDFRESNPDSYNCFNPLSSTFTALENHASTEKDKSQDRKLAGILLDIALDELSSKEPELEISQSDVFQLFANLKYSQNMQEPKQMEYLKETFRDIFKLKDIEKTEDTEKKLNGNTKYARAIIKQVLSD